MKKCKHCGFSIFSKYSDVLFHNSGSCLEPIVVPIPSLIDASVVLHEEQLDAFPVCTIDELRNEFLNEGR